MCVIESTTNNKGSRDYMCLQFPFQLNGGIRALICWHEKIRVED